jgi:hypothetical protein
VFGIEAFDFEGAQPICERIASEPIMLPYHLTTHVLGWLGLTRLGAGALDWASEAFERLATTVEAIAGWVLKVVVTKHARRLLYNQSCHCEF